MDDSRGRIGAAGGCMPCCKNSLFSWFAPFSLSILFFLFCLCHFLLVCHLLASSFFFYKWKEAWLAVSLPCTTA